MPYYIFKGLRVDEGKYLVDLGLISYEELKMYLYLCPANPEYYKEVETNKDGKRLWMVTTSRDNVTTNNIKQYLHEEGSNYKLPKYPNVSKWYSTSENKYYNPGDSVKVNHGMHFIEIK
jgi:hypothetical protein